MGKYRKKIQEAIKTISGLNPEDKDFYIKKLKAFEEIHKNIERHLNEEIKEERDLANLSHALNNYRKHLEFTKLIMENKVPSDTLSEEDIAKLSELHKAPFNNKNDYLYVLMQLESALKEYHFITQNLSHLLKEEKIKLE